MRKHRRRSYSLPVAIERLEPRLALSSAKTSYAAPVGTLTLAFESAIQSVIASEIQTYTGELRYFPVGSPLGPGQNVDPTHLMGDLMQINNLLARQEALTRPLVQGRAKSVTLGTSGRHKVVLDKKALSSSDQIIAQAIIAEAGVEGVSLNLVSTKSEIDEKSNGRVSVPSELVPYLMPVVTWVTSAAPSAIIQGGTAVRNVFTYLLGGKSFPTGALVYVDITMLTFSLANAVESGTRSIITDNTDLQVPDQLLAATFLADSFSDGGFSNLINEIQSLKNYLKDLGTSADGLSQPFTDIESQINPDVPGSVDNQIDRSNGSITPNPTPTPTPTEPQAQLSVDPATLTFQAIMSGSSPASQTITVTNSGEPGSELQYTVQTSPSAPFPVTVSLASDSVAAGGSSTVSVSVNSSGLASGTYSTYVIIYNSLSSSESVTVPITLTVRSESTNYKGTMTWGGFDAYFNPLTGTSQVSVTVSSVDPSTGEIGGGSMNITNILGETIQGPITGIIAPDGTVQIQLNSQTNDLVDFDGTENANGSLNIDSWHIQTANGGNADSSYTGSLPMTLSQ